MYPIVLRQSVEPHAIHPNHIVRMYREDDGKKVRVQFVGSDIHETFDVSYHDALMVWKRALAATE